MSEYCMRESGVCERVVEKDVGEDGGRGSTGRTARRNQNLKCIRTPLSRSDPGVTRGAATHEALGTLRSPEVPRLDPVFTISSPLDAGKGSQYIGPKSPVSLFDLGVVEAHHPMWLQNCLISLPCYFHWLPCDHRNASKFFTHYPNF